MIDTSKLERVVSLTKEEQYVVSSFISEAVHGALMKNWPDPGPAQEILNNYTLVWMETKFRDPVGKLYVIVYRLGSNGGYFIVPFLDWCVKDYENSEPIKKELAQLLKGDK